MDEQQLRSPGFFASGGEVDLQRVEGIPGGIAVQQGAEPGGQQLPQVDPAGGRPKACVDGVIFIAVAVFLRVQGRAQGQRLPCLPQGRVAGLRQIFKGRADPHRQAGIQLLQQGKHTLLPKQRLCALQQQNDPRLQPGADARGEQPVQLQQQLVHIPEGRMPVGDGVHQQQVKMRPLGALLLLQPLGDLGYIGLAGLQKIFQPPGVGDAGAGDGVLPQKVQGNKAAQKLRHLKIRLVKGPKQCHDCEIAQRLPPGAQGHAHLRRAGFRVNEYRHLIPPGALHVVGVGGGVEGAEGF